MGGTLSTVLRIAPVVAGAALVATGVAAPVGGALIAAGAGIPANVAADAIDRGEQDGRNTEFANQAKKETDRKLKEEAEAANRKAEEVKQAFEAKATGLELHENVMKLCREGPVTNVLPLLQKMSNEEFIELGNAPVAACRSADDRAKILRLLRIEKTRRKLA